MKLKIEKEEYINKTFRLSRKLVSEMEKVCDDKEISLNRLFDICVRFALANLDKEEDN